MPSGDTTNQDMQEEPLKQARNKFKTARHTVVNNIVELENTYLIAVSLSQSH
jgi:hypothetical protein